MIQAAKPRARPYRGGWAVMGHFGAVFGATLTDALRLHFRSVLHVQTRIRA
jgi:hypothetical protein